MGGGDTMDNGTFLNFFLKLTSSYSQKGEENGMENISRRDLIGGAAMGAAAMGMAAALPALADEDSTTLNHDKIPIASVVNRPDQNMRGTNTPDVRDPILLKVLEEAEPEGDLTLPDGRVVPEIYVRLRNRLNRVGFGCGSDCGPNSWDLYLYLWTEQDAEICCKVPNLQWFNAYDAHVATGMPIDEVAAALDDMTMRGLIVRSVRGGKNYYVLQPHIAGYWETTELIEYYKNGEDPLACTEVCSKSGVSKDYTWAFPANQFGQCTSDPISIDVVAEDEFMPYFDWRQRVRNNNFVSVAACQCMIRNLCIDGVAYPDEFPLKRCLYLGESGEYFVGIGAAEQITAEEAIAIGEECIDAGMVPEHVSCLDSDIICFCHCKECNQLQSIKAQEGQNPVALANYTAYNLSYDPEKCISCGACVERCPMFAIHLDDEGHCVHSDVCVRCGQCVSVCPADARVLVARDDWPYEVYPYDYQVDNQRFFAKERLMRGLITDWTATEFPADAE